MCKSKLIKGCLLLAFCGSVMALVLYLRSPAFVSWVCSSWCRSHLNGTLQMEAISKEGGKWHLHHAKLLLTETAGQSPIELSIGTLEVKITLNLFQRICSVEAIIFAPAIKLISKESSSLENMHHHFTGAIPFPDFFHFDVQVFVDSAGGKILLQQDHPLLFSGNYISSGMKQICHLQFREEESQELQLILDYQKSAGQAWQWKAICQKLPFSRFWEVCEAFTYQTGFHVREGEVNGSLLLTGSPGEIAVLDGELAFDRLRLENGVKQIEISLPELVSQFKPNNYWGSRSFPFTAEIGCKKPAFIRMRQTNRSLWEMGQIIGQLALFPSGEVKVALQGNCQHGEHQFPIDLQGNWSEDKWHHPTFQAMLSLDQATCHIYNNPLRSKNYLGQLELRSVSEREFAFVQGFFEKIDPNWGSVSIDRALLNASGIVQIKSEGMRRVILDHLSIEGLALSFPALDKTLSIDQATGRIVFPLEKERFLSELKLHLWMENAKIGFGDDRFLQAADAEFSRSLQHGSIGGISEQLKLKEVFFLQAEKKQLFSGNIDLQGQWAPPQKTSSSSFIGSMHAQECGIGLVSFKELRGKVAGSVRKINLSDLTLLDPAGDIKIEKMEWDLENSRFVLPHVKLIGFFPHLMQVNNEIKISISPLFNVTHLDIYDFEGKWGDPHTFQARGKVCFSNRKVDATTNSLFQLPVSLLSRFSLEPLFFNPICGTISFEVADEQVRLTRLKDMYSEGQFSKFQLAGHRPSYVDFNGNLNIHLRLRQPQLAFKFTDSLSLSIEGTLQEPRYTLKTRAPGKGVNGM